MGNPTGTFWDLVLKIASTQGRALYWKEEFGAGGSLHGHVRGAEPFDQFNDCERKWKALALIIDSFDEWGRDAGDFILDLLKEEL